MFGRKTRFLFKVDILGTGTTCQLGAHLPRLDQVETAAGFVDLRHAYLQAKAGRWLWVPPHEAGWMTSTMTEDLHATSLFMTFNRASPPALRAEIAAVVSARTPYSGQRFRPLRQAGLLP
ncbi:MAG: hypothetical protein II336_13470 [Loktanella sp.]|nr:hypothetical protein [Loktanella sp.]